MPNVRGRALLSLVFMIGFFVLVTLVAVVLIVLPVVGFLLFDRLIWLLFAGSAVGATLLRSLVPHRPRLDPPGVQISAEDQPELVRLVYRVAEATGEEPPDAIFLNTEMNAAVTTVGRTLGLAGKRWLIIGVPLMEVLDREEFAAVLAHEFGHFAGGDTDLGGLVYRTRLAMGQVVHSTENAALQRVFLWYAMTYLRVSQSVSRAQEYRADRVAADLVGPLRMSGALARLPAAATAYENYMRDEYGPVVSAGFRVRFVEGFRLHWLASHDDPELSESVGEAFGASSGSAFDSHPPAGDRIRALGVDPLTLIDRPLSQTPASDLLRDRAQLDDLVMDHQLRRGIALTPIAWEDAAARVLPAHWRDIVAVQLTPVLPDLRPAGLPNTEDGLADLGARVLAHYGDGATRPDRVELGWRLGGALLCAAAVHAGWRPQSLPGSPIEFIHGGSCIDPLGAWREVVEEDEVRTDWGDQLSQAGLNASALEITEAAGLTPGIGSAMVLPAVGGLAASPVGFDAARSPTGYDGVPPAQRPLGTRDRLVVTPDSVTYGKTTLRADEVESFGYEYREQRLLTSQDIRVRVELRGVSGRILYRAVARNQRARAETVHVVEELGEWFDRKVMPRLVDELLVRIAAGEEVEVAGLRLTRSGVRSGRSELPYADIVGVSVDGTSVVVRRRADNAHGSRDLQRTRTSTPNAVLWGPLVRAAIMEFTPSNR